MSLSSETARQQYSGDGSTVLFAVPFHFETLSTDVKAYLTDADGVDTELTYVAGSSPSTGQFALVNLTQDSDGIYTAANVKTGDTPAAASGADPAEKVTILRGIPLKQTTDVQAADGFPPSSAEITWDRAVEMIQRLSEKIARSIKFRVGYNSTDIPIEDPEAGKYLRWNSDGDGLENVSLLAADAAQCEHGIETLGNGVTSVSVIFTTSMADPDYTPGFSFINTADTNPIIMQGQVTAQSQGGFTVTFLQATDSTNYKMAWSALGDPS